MNGKLRTARVLLIILCFACFFLYAVLYNSFGTNVSAIMAFFGIDEAGSGLILTVQAISSMAATVFLGLFGERLNKIRGIVFGILVMALSALLIGFIPSLAGESGLYTLMLILSLAAGLGYITVDLLMNGLIVDVFPKQKDSFLQFVHAFYSTGAMIAPLIVTFLVNPQNAESFARPYLLIGTLSLVVFVLFALVGRKILPTTPYADMRAIRAEAKGDPAEIFRDARSWFFLVACFFYMSFQTGISTWLPSFCANHLGYDFASAGLMVTLYFLGALIIRFLSPLIYKVISVRSFYIISLLSAAVLFLLFLFLPMPVGAAKALLVAMGLLQGCGMPSLIILACDAFPTRTASASSLIVFGISLSILVIPAAMGQLIKASGYIAPMLLITACLILSVAVLLPVEKMGRKKSPPENG